MKHSIAVRLAGMFALASIVGFALIGAALHHVLVRELARHQNDQITNRIADISYVLEHARSPGLGERMRQKLDALESAGPRTRVWMWSKDPAFQYGTDVSQMLGLVRDNSPGAEVDIAGNKMRLKSRTVPANDLWPEVRFAVGVDSQPFISTLHAFEKALLALTLTGTCLAAALGWWIARLGLAPVERLSADAQRVGPGNRAQRLQLPSLPRELADLGMSFNQALDRLDAAYHQLETFSDDVAHELRTPLANLIGQTQVTLARERDAGELREVLQSNLEELERLRAIVADMLFLARAEQGAKARSRVDASIADEVGKTVEFLDVLLDDARMTVEVRGDATAPIETSLFRRALTNLLHNAIQHSTGGAEIRVEIVKAADHARVRITNPSAPIAPEQLARLFDRFYRVDTSRPNSGENHGLGLAIVKAVAAMHRGEVFAEYADGRATIGFSVSLN
ncbi:heavy metal sensor histidine kinase [Paucibacter sp. R3-3]|uniref:Sensor protein n=1 Tax=Roseateles agri TaxID=3098619 RepID=A0ABU5DDK9_9BURK|nr:heavy metal sensor histidine kinase [Paucibacter sp. R3-3]MDY0744368.1 heavy metal sensor histidine kinase [Paucibacter sp. R3-3]